jgi:putative SOS response-associated peptidase YedK
MCGRVRLSSDVGEIKLVFSIPPDRPTPNIAPSWNVAPTDPLPVVRFDARAGERTLDVMRWGLVPFWAKDIKVGFANINAKAEGIEGKPAFREAFQRRRCLVPVDNFYEWKKIAAGKQPYAIALADRGLMALAGLWETWRSPAGERVRSFAIITTMPNELCAELHNRMPVVLKPEGWPATQLHPRSTPASHGRPPRGCAALLSSSEWGAAPRCRHFARTPGRPPVTLTFSSEGYARCLDRHYTSLGGLTRRSLGGPHIERRGITRFHRRHPQSFTRQLLIYF